MHIVAHRGFSGRYPEMSPLAYEKALELPIHGVECDVRLTADGHLVCVHDRTVTRATGRPVAVSATTVSQLKRLNIGDHDVQRILTLDELLDMVVGYENKHLYIEAKHPTRFGPMVEEAVALRLRYHGLMADPRIHFLAFSPSAVRRMGVVAPSVEKFWLRRDWDRRLDPTVRLSTAARRFQWGLGMSVARARLAAKAAPHTQPVAGAYVWTVNAEAEMLWVRDAGAAVLATDFPDVAARILSSE